MKYAFNRNPTEERVVVAWSRRNREMQEVLDEVIQGKHSKEDLEAFFQQAIKDGKPLAHDPEMVFWGYDEPNTMPSDARCDFFYLPTYIMVSTMIAAIDRYPELIEMEGVSDTLARGMNACTGRGFQGHGIDVYDEFDNMDRFTLAGARRFLHKYPMLSMKFTKLYCEIIHRVGKEYLSRKHVFGWNCDCRERQKRLLDLYRESKEKSAKDSQIKAD